jgi:hypothetical protein
MFDIHGTEMLETKLDPSQLDRKAKAAQKKLRNTIDQMMQGTLSPHARKLVDAYGNPLSQK